MAHILSIPPAIHSTAAGCAEAAALAEELGLEQQARRYKKPLAENVFTPMTRDEIRLWLSHCGMRYTDKNTKHGDRPMEQYSFDSIPIEVLRHWKMLKDIYAFDRYEIWTTERQTAQVSDPLLLGFLGPSTYLLARWGLESPDQMPLREIAQGIYDRARRWEETLLWDYPFQSKKRKFASALKLHRRQDDLVAVAERYLGLLAE